MLSIQENKISMYFKVQTFLGTHGTALSSAVPALAQKMTEFTDILKQIEETVGIANENNQGYTLHKNQCRETLRNRMLEGVGALRSYALSANDLILAGKAGYNKSSLDAMRDTEMLYMASRFYLVLTENQGELDNYGFTAPQLGLFNQAIQAFGDAIQNPADQRGNSKAANQQLLVYLDNADNCLSIIDSMMETQRFSQEFIYNQYRADRLIDDNASGQSDPVVIDTIPAKAMKAVFSHPYAVNNRFKIRNEGSKAISWGLSTQSAAFTDASYIVDAGATSTRLSSAMASQGDYVLVQNNSDEDVEVTLFMEQL